MPDIVCDLCNKKHDKKIKKVTEKVQNEYFADVSRQY